MKPKNILIDDNFEVKITDFGIAKIVEGTKSTVALGLSERFAPYEIHNGSKVSKKSDIWSLGCIIYFIFTGNKPWPDPKELESWYNEKKVKFKTI